MRCGGLGLGVEGLHLPHTVPAPKLPPSLAAQMKGNGPAPLPDPDGEHAEQVFPLQPDRDRRSRVEFVGEDFMTHIASVHVALVGH